VPHRGKQNEPAYVPLVGTAVGSLRGLDAEEIAAVTWENTSVAFKLPRTLHTPA
jgi:Tat protein secretion system quality control protein TatD with DNase activity